MSLTMSNVAVSAFVRGLNVLSSLLKKAEAFGTDPDSLLTARLIDDMLPLTAQVQRASDTVKFAMQRLSGGTGPVFADDETTFAQLQDRIAQTLAYVHSVDASLLDASNDREIKLAWTESGPVFTGESYLLAFALPNFYFHVVTAYGILRHKGVPVGKLDYLGELGQQ